MEEGLELGWVRRIWDMDNMGFGFDDTLGLKIAQTLC